MRSLKSLGLAVLALAALSSVVSAQLVPPGHTPGTAGDGVPDLRYNPATGVVTFNADGGRAQSLLIPSAPVASSFLNGDGSFPGAGDCINGNFTLVLPGPPFRVITGGCNPNFNGRSQRIMFTDTGNRGWDNNTDLPILQLPPGTPISNLDGLVEMSTWDTDPNNPPPSTTLFTRVVPEPGCLAILGIALLGLSAYRRS